MKNKYIAKLLMGVATVSIATIVSNGQADASEQEPSKSGLAPAADQTFESAKVSPEQKAFYQVLHMDGITEEQRDQYIKQLHEDKNSAQNVFSESIKDSQRPDRRVAQQNAFYEILNNEDITDEQRDRYISEIKENPDAAQKVFVESVNQTETKPAEPQIEPENWEEKWQEQPQQEEQKPEVPKVEEKKEEQPQAPKVENKKEEKAPEAKQPEVKKEEQKPEVQKPEVQNQGQNQATPSQPSVPSTPQVEAPSKSTWTDLWNDFKRPFEDGYTYIKDSANKAYNYVTESYNNLTKKYNEAKDYSKLYFKYKDAIDITVLGFLNKDGTRAYIKPIQTTDKDNAFYKAYAKTSNFVTSSINTGRVLHTLYKNPTIVKTAITAADTANKVKNFFGGFFPFFK
ncbi:B domain-containing protein [Staphylococcus coagulans]|uniref:B domain-containing protein n=1 Tax=Staphylococcus coagulans TaxID=74706 RepID=A0A9X0TMB9_9STAP|nr:B domain-containing protein [Staphylococcus coagulans]MBA8772004.1 B domain-containing protein [Staphylococcus coagulans]MBA8776797.1 B domain-containing protein [Staphylococcus coagulans]